MLIASSMSLKRMMGDTGPKVSSLTSSISGRTWSTTVGEYRAPRRWLPSSSFAPWATASFTRDSKNFAAGSSITVPMSRLLSLGSP